VPTRRRHAALRLCSSPLVWLGDNHVASIDVFVLDHSLGAYRLLRTLGPEEEVSTLEVPVRIKVPWNQLSSLTR
jgi:hypothetical protein